MNTVDAAKDKFLANDVSLYYNHNRTGHFLNIKPAVAAMLDLLGDVADHRHPSEKGRANCSTCRLAEKALDALEEVLQQ